MQFDKCCLSFQCKCDHFWWRNPFLKVLGPKSWNSYVGLIWQQQCHWHANASERHWDLKFQCSWETRLICNPCILSKPDTETLFHYIYCIEPRRYFMSCFHSECNHLKHQATPFSFSEFWADYMDFALDLRHWCYTDMGPFSFT